MGEEVREEACGRKWVSGERRGRREWGSLNKGAGYSLFLGIRGKNLKHKEEKWEKGEKWRDERKK